MEQLGTWTLNEHGEWHWSALPVCRETEYSYDVLAAVELGREAARLRDDFWDDLARQHNAHCHRDGSTCPSRDACEPDYGCA